VIGGMSAHRWYTLRCETPPETWILPGEAIQVPSTTNHQSPIANHQSPLTVPPVPGDDGVPGVNLPAPGF
jgi:hypothetical protein